MRLELVCGLSLRRVCLGTMAAPCVQLEHAVEIPLGIHDDAVFVSTLAQLPEHEAYQEAEEKLEAVP